MQVFLWATFPEIAHCPFLLQENTLEPVGWDLIPPNEEQKGEKLRSSHTGKAVNGTASSLALGPMIRTYLLPTDSFKTNRENNCVRREMAFRSVNTQFREPSSFPDLSPLMYFTVGQIFKHCQWTWWH